LNALFAIVSTPISAPVVVATRLRRGPANSARGAARIVADALVTAKACGGTGLFTVRADSAYYGHDVVAAARRGGARFSVTVRMNRTVVKAISGIEESAWVPIHYPNAIWDEDEQRLVSDAEVHRAKRLCVRVADRFPVNRSPDRAPKDSLEREPPRVVEPDHKIHAWEDEVEPRAVCGVEDPAVLCCDCCKSPALLILSDRNPTRRPGELVGERQGQRSPCGDPLRGGALARAGHAVDQNSAARVGLLRSWHSVTIGHSPRRSFSFVERRGASARSA